MTRNMKQDRVINNEPTQLGSLTLKKLKAFLGPGL